MANVRGVEVRAASIRINFTAEGGLKRKTLLVNGVPMAPTAANIRFAARLVADIRALVRAGAFSMEKYFPEAGTVGRGGTLAHHLDTWLGLQKVEYATLRGYVTAINYWKGDKNLPKQLGEKPLETIVHSDIRRALARKEISGKTQKNYLQVLMAAFTLAVRDGLIKTNPCEGVSAVAYQKTGPDPFDLEEVERIVAYMHEHYHPWVANMFEWRFFVGVRSSEMIGLRRQSIDWNKRVVQITEAVVHGRRKGTKTHVVRVVDLNSRAFAALKRQCELLDQPDQVGENVYRLPNAGATPPPAAKDAQAEADTVWLNPRSGKPWYVAKAYLEVYWKPALVALGIRYRPPNTARHTYATMLLMAGNKPAYAAKQMGHSVELFLKTYSKWLDNGENEREQNRLESFITPDRPAGQVRQIT